MKYCKELEETAIPGKLEMGQMGNRWREIQMLAIRVNFSIRIITGITASRCHSCPPNSLDVFDFEYEIHQSLLSFICSSSFLLSDALETRCTLCSLSNRTDIHIQDTNIAVQFRSIGRLTTIDMNSPLLSKYWCLVKILQRL